MSCSASCQGMYRPSHEKSSLRITGPFWRRVILDIRTRHMLRLHVHPPWQKPSAQRKRFSTRCICTQTAWGDLLCLARRSVVVYCEETFLGLDLWWGFFGGIFWWDFSGFFFFLRENSQKNPQKKSAPKIRTGHHKIREKIRTPNPRRIRTPKSASKNPHQKIRVKNPHPHVRAKIPTSPWVKQTPANQYQKRLWTACPTWRLICHASKRPRQFYTDHHILISRCWQRKNQKRADQWAWKQSGESKALIPWLWSFGFVGWKVGDLCKTLEKSETLLADKVQRGDTYQDKTLKKIRTFSWNTCFHGEGPVWGQIKLTESFQDPFAIRKIFLDLWIGWFEGALHIWKQPTTGMTSITCWWAFLLVFNGWPFCLDFLHRAMHRRQKHLKIACAEKFHEKHLEWSWLSASFRPCTNGLLLQLYLVSLCSPLRIVAELVWPAWISASQPSSCGDLVTLGEILGSIAALQVLLVGYCKIFPSACLQAPWASGIVAHRSSKHEANITWDDFCNKTWCSLPAVKQGIWARLESSSFGSNGSIGFSRTGGGKGILLPSEFLGGLAFVVRQRKATGKGEMLRVACLLCVSWEPHCCFPGSKH